MPNTTSPPIRALVTGVAAALVAGVPAVVLRRVIVAGHSMVPTFLPGDRLVVMRWLPLRPGRVIAVRDPRQPERLLVKRVADLSDTHADLRGDNDAASTDSRTFGPVERRRVIGTVVYRYHPADRVGWWP